MKQLIFSLLLLVSFSNANVIAQCTNPPTYNDPEPNQQQYDMMNIPCAWTITNGDPSITVCALDRHFTDAHDDISGKVIEIWGPCKPWLDAFTHGNQSFGAVAAIRNNNLCIAGSGGLTTVAGYCSGGSDNSIQQAVDHGYKIITISTFGTISKQKLEQVTSEGVTVLVAGLCLHHEADDPEGYHSVPGVIHVGRADLQGNFSNYTNEHCVGTLNMNLDVLAVADGLMRMDAGNSCKGSGGGTSIGTPTVAGVVALMKDVNPCLRPGDIEEILVETSQPIPSNAHSGATRGGIIDAYEAVLMAQNFDGFDKIWDEDASYSTGSISGDLNIKGIGTNIIIESGGIFYFGDNSIITIEAGAELKIEGQLKMGNNAKIIVERGARLIVDGGHLLAADCATEWRGIVVEGNIWEEQQTLLDPQQTNKNGIVYFTNNAIIEHAKTAVSMAPNHVGWPTVKYYYGGLLVADDNTIFRNNRRAAEFMQYRAYSDKSSFLNCTFDGHDVVASHWNNHGVTYESCDFLNYDLSALRTYDAAINVTHSNTFDNLLHDDFENAAIDLYHTYLYPHGSKIGESGNVPNEFSGGYHGIYSLAGGQSTTEIVNNKFISGEVAYTFEGLSDLFISSNDLIGCEIGSRIISTGAMAENNYENNQFSSVDNGILCHFDNINFKFLSNCFDFGTYFDFSLFNGRIAQDQGNPDFSASNIFNTVSSRRIQTPSNSEIFTYHIQKDELNGSREISPSYAGNFQESIDKLSQLCGSNGSPGPIDLGSFVCNIPLTKPEILDYITDLNNTLDQLEDNLDQVIPHTSGWYAIRYLIAEVNACIIQAKKKLNSLAQQPADYPDLISYFSTDHFNMQALLLSTMIHNGDYLDAESYLTQMDNSTEEGRDFIFTQSINLDHLQSQTYNLSPQDSIELLDISYKTYPLSAFSRSLFYVLTDIKIELPLNEGGSNQQRVISNSESVKTNTLIFPNPSQGEYTVNLNFNFASDVVIYDIMGREVFRKNVQEGDKIFDINLTAQTSGVYYVLIRQVDTNELIHFEQIIKI